MNASEPTSRAVSCLLTVNFKALLQTEATSDSGILSIGAPLPLGHMDIAPCIQELPLGLEFYNFLRACRFSRFSTLRHTNGGWTVPPRWSRVSWEAAPLNAVTPKKAELHVFIGNPICEGTTQSICSKVALGWFFFFLRRTHTHVRKHTVKIQICGNYGKSRYWMQKGLANCDRFAN